MIVKGLIKTIDISDNSCTVRLPIFETAASQGEVVLKAVISTVPGMYSGYTVGDIVFVDFENNKLNQPIVVGKLYLGANAEEASKNKGGLTVSNLTVSSSASLPIDTKLVLEDLGNIAPVDNGITSYKSISDIIKALYKAESSVGQLNKDQSEIIANIKVEYLLQPITAPAPTADNPDWASSTPEYKDEHSIWQKTTCSNHRGQILNTEIICLSAVASSVVYRLRCSTKVHSGLNQSEDVTITAMVKFGSEFETEDTSAKLYYKWGEEGEERAVNEIREEVEGEDVVITHTVTFQAKTLEEKNLIITAKHENESLDTTTILDTETIMYSPLNTPLLVLSNDTDTLLYSAAGIPQTTPNSTASLYLNGEELEAVYTWTFTNCEGEISGEGRTVTVKSISITSQAAKATCTATVTNDLFKDKQYFREFTITPTRIGTSIDLQTTYYALIHPSYLAGTISAPSEDNLAVQVESGKTAEEHWNTVPPAHTDETRIHGWKYWTTVRTAKSDGTVVFSDPIINEDLNGVYALAQGKTTNYYSDTDPSEHCILKEGDCWFNTGYTEVPNYSTFKLTSAYIGKYIEVGEDKVKITPETITQYQITPGTTRAYSRGELYQWNGEDWEEISDELVTNKLTANYINALDITAKKIEILDSSSPPKPLFKADGLSSSNKVEIAGFTVDNNSLLSKNAGLGETNSVLISTGTASTANIGGSGEVAGWNFTAGNNFGVRTDTSTNSSELYVNRGKIGGFEIADTGIKTGDLGETDGIYLGNNDTTPVSISGAEKTDWRLLLGSNFGVDSTGSLYASAGKVGGFNIDSSKLYYYNSKKDSSGNEIGSGAGVGGIPYGGSWAFWAGSQTGNGKETVEGGNPYGWDAPFRVGHNGEMFATKGEIGGFTIGDTTLKGGTNGTVGINSNNASGTYAFWAGNATPASASFSVTNAGVVKATNLTIQNMTASGTSGVTINGGKFTVKTKDASPTTLFEVDSSESKTTLSGDIHNVGNIFSGCKKTSENTISATTTTGGNIYSGGIIQSIGGIVNNKTLINTGLVYSNGGIINSGILHSNDTITSNGKIYATGNVYFYATVEESAGSVRYGGGYNPVIQLETGNSNSIYTKLVTVLKDATGGSTLDAQWFKIDLPEALRSKSNVNDKVKGVFVTGYLSSQNVSWSQTTDGSCGTTNTTTGTSVNIGAQAQTHYVNWDKDSAYVLIPKKITISSIITSKFDIKLCVLIVGSVDVTN